MFTQPCVLFLDCKTRVAQLIRETKENPRQVDLYRLVDYLFITLSLMTFLHLTFYGTFFAFPFRAAFAVASGLFTHLLMTHIAHDMAHNSFTSNHTFWYYVGSLNDYLVGLSRLVWIYRHNLGHHVYTNVKLADPDISYYHDLDQDNIFYKAPLKLDMPIYFKPLLYSIGTFLVRVEEKKQLNL